MKEILEINQKLQQLLYAAPLSKDLEIEGLGMCTFTTTKDLNGAICEGFVEVFATYKTHEAIFDIDLNKMEVESSRIHYIDHDAISRQVSDYYTYEKGVTCG
tara:strand:+ start:9736 stop:10041 length:306 start_codon:yes stop_codon:yes gene_type:complete